MPPLHRWLGNPILSFIGRLFFRVHVSDFYCGLRAFRREAIARMDLRTTGMELASEMVVKAALFGLRIGEVPVTLRPDGRARPPHLRTWHDGWRGLRFLLLYSPRWLYLVPGLFLTGFGAFLILWLFGGPRRFFGLTLDVHTMLGGTAMILVGTQAILFGVFAKIFAITEGLRPTDALFARLFDRYVTLETGLLTGALTGLLGLALVARVVVAWRAAGWGALDEPETLRWMIPGTLLVALGTQAIFASFFLSLLGLKRR
jgi:hypothetical protein